MSSSSRRIPKYQHFKPRNLAKVRIDGRDIYLGPYDSPESHTKYQRVIAEWLTEKQDLPDKRLEITICELMACYVKHAGEYYVKDGQRTREYGCICEALRPVRRLYELALVDDFGPRYLRAVRQEMVSLGWSRRHVNKMVGRVVRMFRWGVSQELVKPATYEALRCVDGLKKGRTEAPDRPPVKPVDDSVVEATMEELSPLVADMVRVQRLTGMRPGEVCLLRPDDIDRSGKVWIFTPEKHKTEHMDRVRTIHIGPKAQGVLLKYLVRAGDSYCFDPREAPGARSNSRNRYTKDSYGRAVRRAVHRINQRRRANHGDDAKDLQTWSPNRLRHAAATQIREQFGLEAAQAALGHASADVTQIYAERNHKLAADVARKLG